MSNKGLLFALVLDGKGGGKNISWNEIRQWKPNQGVLWLHFDYTAAEVQKWLTEESGLDQVAYEALLSEESRPRTTLIDGAILVALRGVNLNPEADPEDMVAVRFWAEKNRVISTRKRPLLSVSEIAKSIKNNTGPATTGELIVELSDRLTSRMEGTIGEIEDQVARIEEEIVESSRMELRNELSIIRREVIMLRRYLAPQREALSKLYTEKIPWFDDTDRLHMREVTDKLIRYIEDLDSLRDRASVTQEELVNRISEQMNVRMYVLSLVAAIFLPLGFLTGLLGINVGGIPGANNNLAFLIFIIILIIVVILQYILFKKKKWL